MLSEGFGAETVRCLDEEDVVGRVTTIFLTTFLWNHEQRVRKQGTVVVAGLEDGILRYGYVSFRIGSRDCQGMEKTTKRRWLRTARTMDKEHQPIYLSWQADDRQPSTASQLSWMPVALRVILERVFWVKQGTAFRRRSGTVSRCTTLTSEEHNKHWKRDKRKVVYLSTALDDSWRGNGARIAFISNDGLKRTGTKIQQSGSTANWSFTLMRCGLWTMIQGVGTVIGSDERSLFQNYMEEVGSFFVVSGT